MLLCLAVHHTAHNSWMNENRYLNKVGSLFVFMDPRMLSALLMSDIAPTPLWLMAE